LLAARKGVLHWEHVADCPGPTGAREVSVQWEGSAQRATFLIGAPTTGEMRMLSVSNRRSSQPPSGKRRRQLRTTTQ
jgi:hypothetical protein